MLQCLLPASVNKASPGFEVSGGSVIQPGQLIDVRPATGARVVSAGGGNVVSAGGGNVVSAGGANVTVPVR